MKREFVDLGKKPLNEQTSLTAAGGGNIRTRHDAALASIPAPMDGVQPGMPGVTGQQTMLAGAGTSLRDYGSLDNALANIQMQSSIAAKAKAAQNPQGNPTSTAKAVDSRGNTKPISGSQVQSTSGSGSLQAAERSNNANSNANAALRSSIQSKSASAQSNVNRETNQSTPTSAPTSGTTNNVGGLRAAERSARAQSNRNARMRANANAQQANIDQAQTNQRNAAMNNKAANQETANRQQVRDRAQAAADRGQAASQETAIRNVIRQHASDNASAVQQERGAREQQMTRAQNAVANNRAANSELQTRNEIRNQAAAQARMDRGARRPEMRRSEIARRELEANRMQQNFELQNQNTTVNRAPVTRDIESQVRGMATNAAGSVIGSVTADDHLQDNVLDTIATVGQGAKTTAQAAATAQLDPVINSTIRKAPIPSALKNVAPGLIRKAPAAGAAFAAGVDTVGTAQGMVVDTQTNIGIAPEDAVKPGAIDTAIGVVKAINPESGRDRTQIGFNEIGAGLRSHEFRHGIDDAAGYATNTAIDVTAGSVEDVYNFIVDPLPGEAMNSNIVSDYIQPGLSNLVRGAVNMVGRGIEAGADLPIIGDIPGYKGAVDAYNTSTSIRDQRLVGDAASDLTQSILHQHFVSNPADRTKFENSTGMTPGEFDRRIDALSVNDQAWATAPEPLDLSTINTTRPSGAELTARQNKMQGRLAGPDVIVGNTLSRNQR